MKFPHNVQQVVVLFCAIVVGGCAFLGVGHQETSLSDTGFPRSVETSIEQVVLVRPVLAHPTRAEVTLWQKRHGAWQAMDSPIKAVIGRNGLAPLNEKQEGDGRTPSGIFRLERAFGYPVKVRTKLVYAPVDEDDFWVDDPAAATYNRWVKGLPKAGSFERLRREDFLYRYAIVVEYNTNPIVAGKGSAIFVHVWRTPESSTAGCVAMSAGNVRRLLRWLDPEQNPVIILGDQEGAT